MSQQTDAAINSFRNTDTSRQNGLAHRIMSFSAPPLRASAYSAFLPALVPAALASGHSVPPPLCRAVLYAAPQFQPAWRQLLTARMSLFGRNRAAASPSAPRRGLVFFSAGILPAFLCGLWLRSFFDNRCKTAIEPSGSLCFPSRSPPRKSLSASDSLKSSRINIYAISHKCIIPRETLSRLG